MADDRPKISGHIPAAGAPLTSRTLALQPGQQSVTQGDVPWSSQIANAVYDWLGAHGPADMPEAGRENIASAASGASKLLPPVAANEALTSARQGDFPGTVSNLLGAAPIIPGAKAAAVGEDVASSLARRAAESVVAAPAEAAPPIVAYHGSPYSFDRFDISKIGTGEGAQAYGHGLYFAGNEDVAKSYRDSLTAGKWSYAGRPAAETWDASALDYLDKNVADKKGMPAAIDDAVGRLKAQSSFYNDAYAGGSTAPNLYDNAIARLQRLDPEQIKPAGSMYQVGINANPDHFLDWDKPLSAQSPTVQEALGITDNVKDALANHLQSETAKSAYDPQLWAKMKLLDEDPRGSTIAGNTPDASQALRDAGIPGIKYLDQGSRTAGEGSSNYVLFNDSLVNILKKYGIAGLGVAGGAAAVTGGQPTSPAEAETPTPPQPSDQQPPPAPIGSSPAYDDWWKQLQAQQFAGQASQ